MSASQQSCQECFIWFQYVTATRQVSFEACAQEVRKARMLDVIFSGSYSGLRWLRRCLLAGLENSGIKTLDTVTFEGEHFLKFSWGNCAWTRVTCMTEMPIHKAFSAIFMFSTEGRPNYQQRHVQSCSNLHSRCRLQNSLEVWKSL